MEKIHRNPLQMYWQTIKKKWDKEDLKNTISKLKLNAVQRTLNPESKMHTLLLGNIWAWHNLISKIEPGKYNKRKKALGYSP